MFPSVQRNAAFGTAWWALRLDAQAISDVWLLAFACSGRLFGDMFPRPTPFSVRLIAKNTLKFASAGTSCDGVPLQPAQSRSQAGLVHTLTTCQSDFNGLASISIDWRRFSTMKVSITAEPGGRLSPTKIAVRPTARSTSCHRFSEMPL